jgi:DNA-binding GntR family transcriptional regulator
MSEYGQPQSSLAETAYRRIEEMIVMRVLKPGAMISEKRLADDVGCGRTPVREALQRLGLEGYIEVHPSRGVQVSTIDIFRQLELLEVRRPLEDLMVRLAAERITPSERASMTRLAQALAAAAKARDHRGFLVANRSIHDTLAAAARNTILANSIRGLHGLSRRFWFAYVEDEDLFEEAARLHGATLKATAAQDGKAAAANAASFLNFLESLTRKARNVRVQSPPSGGRRQLV